MTDVSRPLRGTLPCLVVLTLTTGFVLPLSSAQAARAVRTTDVASTTRGAEWWLTAMDVPGAWQAAPGKGKGVTVAVLSTGVDASHPDLAGSVAIGRDFCDSGRTAAGPFWGYEGTAVASLLAGHGHGSGGTQGITGVAPAARILGVQVALEYNDPLNSDSAITRRLPDAIAAGIRYAVAHGAGVIALPLDPGTLGPAASANPAVNGSPATGAPGGGPVAGSPIAGSPIAGGSVAGGSPAERAAVGYALTHGVVLVAPAGDNGASSGSVNYPAAYPGVVAVGATARGGQLAPFTSTRSYVALTAPGSGLTVAAPDGAYTTLASSDMSAALTAGVAALIRSRFPRLTPAEVTRALVAGARRPGARRAPGNGNGALDAAGSLAAAATLAAPHPVPAPSTPASSPAPSVPAPHPVAHHVAARPSGLGTLAGSLLRDAVIAACALIAALACALALVGRRRRRAQAARRAQAPQRSGQGGSHARRPRAAGQAQPTGGPATVSWGQPRAIGAAGTPRALGPGSAPRIIPAPVTGSLGNGSLGTSARARRKKATTGMPPWEPASPPANPPTTDPRSADPRSADPRTTETRTTETAPVQTRAAQARAAGTHATTGEQPAFPALPPLPATSGQVMPRGQHAALPPWETAPAEFAAAPVPADLSGWSASNSGPMYVWNPNATTAPQPAVSNDESERTGPPA